MAEEEIKPNKKEITAGLIARKLMETYHFITIKGNKNEDVLTYDANGTYKEGGEIIIRESTQNLCGDNANTHFVNEVIGHIRRSTYIEPDTIDESDNILNVKNGLVNMSTCELSEHTYLYYSMIQLPVEFDKHAKCPKAEAFIESIFTHQDAEIVKEYLGFLFIKNYLFHKALMVTGASHSGKTTFMNLIISLIGSKNIASVTLQDLCDNKFSIAELYKKIANISDDLPANPVKYAGQFKRLTGESQITAERKFRDPFVFTNTAKAIFTCNELPPVQSSDDAYFYRWLIVETSNRFNKDKCNRNMLKEITTPEELSGLLNLALKYRKKLLQQNDFSNNEDIAQSRVKYMLSVKDSVSKFIQEEVIRDTDEFVTKDILYDTYKSWCSDYEFPPKSQNSFHRRFQKLLNKHIQEYYPVICGKQIRSYKGIKLIREIND